MGYVHRTPAWVRPHGAGERRTFWGVVPAEFAGIDIVSPRMMA